MAERGKTWKDKSREELHSEIRRLTKEANVRIAGIKLTQTLPKDVQQAVNYMKQLSGVSKGKGKAEIGVGDLQSKSKQELIQQARELKAFSMWDIESPEALRQLEAREQKEWETFKKGAGREDWTYEEWRKFVEVAGAIGKDVMQKFGSETVLSDFQRRGTNEQANYLKAMRQAIKESDGLTQSQLNDRLRELIAEFS